MGCSCGGNDLVDTDVVVSESSEQEVAFFVPCEAGAADGSFAHLLVGVEWGGHNVGDECFGWEIPNLNTLLGSEDEPVFSRGEENAVNGAVDLSLTQVFAFNEVPDKSETIFTT